jgi:hypothetical protein
MAMPTGWVIEQDSVSVIQELLFGLSPGWRKKHIMAWLPGLAGMMRYPCLVTRMSRRKMVSY